APTSLTSSELDIAITEGDDKRALAIYDAMLPGQRSLNDILPLLAKNRPEAEARIRRDIATAQDGVTMLSRLGLVSAKRAPTRRSSKRKAASWSRRIARTAPRARRPPCCGTSSTTASTRAACSTS